MRPLSASSAGGSLGGQGVGGGSGDAGGVGAAVREGRPLFGGLGGGGRGGRQGRWGGQGGRVRNSRWGRQGRQGGRGGGGSGVLGSAGVHAGVLVLVACGGGGLVLALVGVVGIVCDGERGFGNCHGVGIDGREGNARAGDRDQARVTGRTRRAASVDGVLHLGVAVAVLEVARTRVADALELQLVARDDFVLATGDGLFGPNALELFLLLSTEVDTLELAGRRMIKAQRALAMADYTGAHCSGIVVMIVEFVVLSVGMWS